MDSSIRIHTPVIDALMHEESGGAGADLSLVQSEEHSALNGLVQVGVVVILQYGYEYGVSMDMSMKKCIVCECVWACVVCHTHHHGGEEDQGGLAS